MMSNPAVEWEPPAPSLSRSASRLKARLQQIVVIYDSPISRCVFMEPAIYSSYHLFGVFFRHWRKVQKLFVRVITAKIICLDYPHIPPFPRPTGASSGTPYRRAPQANCYLAKSP